MSSPGSKAGSSVGRAARVPTQAASSQSLAHPRRASARFKHDSAPRRIFISSSIRRRHGRNGPRRAPRANRHKPLLGVGKEIGIAKYRARKPRRRVVSSLGSPAEPQTSPPEPWRDGRSHGYPPQCRGCTVQLKCWKHGGCFHFFHANPHPPKPAHPLPLCSQEKSLKLASRSARQRGSPTHPGQLLMSASSYLLINRVFQRLGTREETLKCFWF